MISRSAQFGDHIVHIDFDLLVHYIVEQGYYGSLVGRPSILQVEWHDIVSEGSLMSGEHCFGFVFFSLLDLILTQELVHKGEKHVDRGVINQGINVWQGKIILRAEPIQISIIDAHVYFPIFLWHRNNVGNPIRVGYGGKKISF